MSDGSIKITIDGIDYIAIRQRIIDNIPDGYAYAPFHTSLPILHQYVLDEDVDTLVKFLLSNNSITLVDKFRLTIVKSMLINSCHLKGEIWECGVYRGGTARFFSELIEKYFSSDQPALRLFDTFSGMPDTDAERDIHKAGDFADTSLSIVKETIGPRPFVHYYPGLVPDTFSGLEDKKIRFIHIDLDIYEGIKGATAFAYPRMEEGGIILFDDYGFASCPGARMAVDEFFVDKAEVPIVLPTGQAFVIKQA